MTTDDRLHARHWIEWAEGYLTENPVVPVEVFEDQLLERFQGEFTDLHDREMRHGDGVKKRTRKMNLTDHVKAQLTRRQRITYLEYGDNTFVVYLPAVGFVQGVGTLVTLRQALNLLDSFVKWLP